MPIETNTPLAEKLATGPKHITHLQVMLQTYRAFKKTGHHAAHNGGKFEYDNIPRLVNGLYGTGG